MQKRMHLGTECSPGGDIIKKIRRKICDCTSDRQPFVGVLLLGCRQWPRVSDHFLGVYVAGTAIENNI